MSGHERLVANIRAEHIPEVTPEGQACEHCEQWWPCPTAQAGDVVDALRQRVGELEKELKGELLVSKRLRTSWTEDTEILRTKLTAVIRAGDTLIRRPMGVVSDEWIEATDWPKR